MIMVRRRGESVTSNYVDMDMGRGARTNTMPEGTFLVDEGDVTATDETEAVIYEGWLRRRSTKTKRWVPCFRWVWRHFVVLEKHMVFMSTFTGNEKYRLNISGAAVQQDDDDPRIFTIKFRAVQSSVTPPEPFDVDGRRFVLMANCEDEAKQWMDVVARQSRKHTMNFAKSHVAGDFRPGLLYGSEIRSSFGKRRSTHNVNQGDMGVWMGVIIKGEMTEIFVPDSIPLKSFVITFIRDNELNNSLAKDLENQIKFCVLEAKMHELRQSTDDDEWHIAEGQVDDAVEGAAGKQHLRFNGGFL